MTMIDDAELVAWIDGELDASDAARVAAAVAADPVLAKHADAHRRLAGRLASGFAPLLEMPATPVAKIPAAAALETPAASTLEQMNVVSLAEARATRVVRSTASNDRRSYAALAATLVAGLTTGLLAGGPLSAPRGIADAPGAMVASGALAAALDQQLSGQPGAVRISLSFRDHGGAYCRSFAGAAVAGIACRDTSRWQVRYAAAQSGATAAYRTAAAGDAGLLAASDAMIDGAPLNADGEQAARGTGWRRR